MSTLHIPTWPPTLAGHIPTRSWQVSATHPNTCFRQGCAGSATEAPAMSEHRLDMNMMRVGTPVELATHIVDGIKTHVWGWCVHSRFLFKTACSRGARQDANCNCCRCLRAKEATLLRDLRVHLLPADFSFCTLLAMLFEDCVCVRPYLRHFFCCLRFASTSPTTTPLHPFFRRVLQHNEPSTSVFFFLLS